MSIRPAGWLRGVSLADKRVSRAHVGRGVVAPATRFWKFVDKYSSGNDCWLWTGMVAGPRGRTYGRFFDGKRDVRAHRFSYELHHGTTIPQGMFACHRCDTPRCVNPNHIWIGTPHQNALDAQAKGRLKRATKLGCRNGHAYTAASVRIRRGFRECLDCMRARRPS